MNYMSNLVDAMLVLAVGFMLALIVNWNINISSTGQVSANQQNVNKDDALTSFEEEDMTSADENDITEESELVEKGTVYYDKKTDTYYIIESDGTETSIEE